MDSIDELRADVTAFIAEREWQPFHTPKNLVMALSVEVAELMEHFQWLTAEDSEAPPAAALAEISDEIADVQVYLVALADRLGVDILEAVAGKMVRNRAKYPAELARGRADKYTAYEDVEEPR